jgi:hypothetical protein
MGDPALEREPLERHLENCPYCRLLVRQFQKEYQELSEKWQSRQNAKAEFHLRPLDFLGPSDTTTAVRLAAQGIEPDSPTRSLTLVSEGQEIFLRAVGDPSSGQTWLYLLSDQSRPIANALVRAFGLDKEFITDDEGRVNLGAVAWPNLKDFRAEVRFPHSVFSLKPLALDQMKDNVLEMSSEKGDRIRITLTSARESRHLEIKVIHLEGLRADEALKIAVRGKDSLKVMELDRSGITPAELDAAEDIGTLEIFIY